MQHKRIITNVNSLVQLDAVLTKLSSEYENLHIETAELKEGLVDAENGSIAVVVSECNPHFLKVFYSDKAMVDGSFDSSKIYQGDNFEECIIESLSNYLCGMSYVSLYDKDENLVKECSTPKELIDYIDKHSEAFIYFNGRTINLCECKQEERKSLIQELYE